MDSPAENARSANEELRSIPTIAAGRGRPEHTIFSILLMALLSAGTLYGVDWTLQEPAEPVYSWDFRSLPYEDSPWDFPRPSREQDPDGMTYLTLDTDPGPMLTMDFDSGAVRQIRATVEVSRSTDDVPFPFELEWYWTSAEAIEAAGEEWPFGTDRGMAFQRLERHSPNTLTAPVYRHERWTGKIAKAFIAVKIPGAEPGPFKIRITHIEFLE